MKGMENIQNYQEPKSARNAEQNDRARYKSATLTEETGFPDEHVERLTCEAGFGLRQLGETFNLSFGSQQTLGDVMELIFSHIVDWACELGCCSYKREFASVFKRSDDFPTPGDLRSILDLFCRINAQVWLREQTFKPESADNLEWRKLGKTMHLFYETLKRINWLLGGEDWRQHQALRKQFRRVFREGVRRAQAGEPIAIEVMRTKWGIQF